MPTAAPEQGSVQIDRSVKGVANHAMFPAQDIPARARQILAKPGFVAGADATELRDLLGTAFLLPPDSAAMTDHHRR